MFESLDLETLQLLWYLIFSAAIFAYAALDGFDIGVGCLHLFVKTDLERRIFLNSIGPVWDGNSLWIIISSGALLAGFPKAFSYLFSILYIPMLFLVFGYIIRGVAIEFRSKMPSQAWRQLWDIVFGVASYSLSFGFGIILANLVKGLPVDSEGNLIYGVSSLFRPYAIGFGVFTTLLFMLHGSLFLCMKTEGALQEKIGRYLQTIYMCFLFLWSCTTIITLIYQPRMTEIFRSNPGCLFFAILGLFGIAIIPKLVSKGFYGWAFLSSFLVIASLIANYAFGTFPYLVRSSEGDDVLALTIYNSSSSIMTMKILFGIALTGIPLFALYLFYTYKIFRGKVELDSMSY